MGYTGEVPHVFLFTRADRRKQTENETKRSFLFLFSVVVVVFF